MLGVKFEKDGTGEYNVRKVHHMGTYVLPMPEGHHVKKALYRQLRRLRVDITNRFMATRLLTAPDGRIAGVIGVNTRTVGIYRRPREGGGSRRAAPPGGSGCRLPAISSAHTRIPPIAAMAMRWPFMPARRSPISNVFRSIR